MGYWRIAATLVVFASLALISTTASAETIDDDAVVGDRLESSSEAMIIAPGTGGFRVSPILPIVFSGAVLAIAVMLTRSGETRVPVRPSSLTHRVRQLTTEEIRTPTWPSPTPAAPPPLVERRDRAQPIPPAHLAPGYGTLITAAPEVEVAGDAEPSENVRLAPESASHTSLTALDGIGAALAGRLEQLGIHSVEALARASESDLDRVRAGLAGQAWRMEQHRWVEQARCLADGDRAT